MNHEPGAPGIGPTGDPDVDAQLQALEQLDDLPVGEHQAVYAAIHEGLRRVLDDDPAGA
ncbi:hypothetical protein [Arthrobacter sp. JSM 101049]|uniref:hypothetical protein n=1 Tax=Arthrobacter sp. JSM 101049 TaxID=929097 RepID=UPI0035692640